MKRSWRDRVMPAAIGLTLLTGAPLIFAQSTAFTYQGRLGDNGAPANGNYNLTFKLFNAASGPAQIGNTVTNSLTVSNGLVTTTLNFNAGAFDGSPRWLEIAVRTNGGGIFNTLNPRQEITATPYALVAGTVTGVLPNASLSGSYGNAVTLNNTANLFTGTFVGDGGGLTNLNATTLDGANAHSFWNINGNSGASPTNGNFLGTIDDQPLELHVNSVRALRLVPNTNRPSILVGLTSVIGTNIAGAAILGGEYNGVYANDSSIAGGTGNQIGSVNDTASLAYQNTNSFIGGGAGNQIRALGFLDGATVADSVIAGGNQNQILTSDGARVVGNTISGGVQNTIIRYSSYATIAGGYNNLITYNSSGAAIGGGSGNYIDTCPGGVIEGGQNNRINYLSSSCTIAGGNLNQIGLPLGLGSSFCNISGGFSNCIQDAFSSSIIGGGQGNLMQTLGYLGTAGCTIAGGVSNRMQTSDDCSFIGAGILNTMLTSSAYSVIGGGMSNTVTGTCAAIVGGLNNTAAANSFASGTHSLATNQGAFVWADYNTSNFPFASINTNEFAARATGGVRFVTAIDGTGSPSAGVKLDPGSTSWATISDRNAKKDFAPVNSEAVLEKLAQVPVEQWRYNWESAGATPHIGPMAQDFKAAFYPGRDDKSITTLEFDGVELAAIQGLNQKLAEKDARIAELEQRLARLEKLVSTGTEKRSRF